MWLICTRCMIQGLTPALQLTQIQLSKEQTLTSCMATTGQFHRLDKQICPRSVQSLAFGHSLRIINNMKMKNVRRQIVAETEYGLYVWYTDDKRVITDDEGRQLSIPAKRGDVKAINALRDAAYGFLGDMGAEKNGQAVFLPGHRQVSDDEYDEQ